MTPAAKRSGRPDAAPGEARQRGPYLVLGYDGSPGARRAVNWAAGVLPDTASLVLVYASRPLHGPSGPLSSAAERRDYGVALIDALLLEGEDALLDRQITTEIVDDDPVKALTDAAARFGADGIVVGTGRHSRVSEAIGTVTHGLLSASSVPVIAVPPSAADGDNEA